MGLFPFWLPEPGLFPTEPPDAAWRFGPLCLPGTVIQHGCGAVGKGEEGKEQETRWITAALEQCRERTLQMLVCIKGSLGEFMLRALGLMSLIHRRVSLSPSAKTLQ